MSKFIINSTEQDKGLLPVNIAGTDASGKSVEYNNTFRRDYQSEAPEFVLKYLQGLVQPKPIRVSENKTEMQELPRFSIMVIEE